MEEAGWERWSLHSTEQDKNCTRHLELPRLRWSQEAVVTWSSENRSHFMGWLSAQAVLNERHLNIRSTSRQGDASTVRQDGRGVTGGTADSCLPVQARLGVSSLNGPHTCQHSYISLPQRPGAAIVKSAHAATRQAVLNRVMLYSIVLLLDIFTAKPCSTYPEHRKQHPCSQEPGKERPL